MKYTILYNLLGLTFKSSISSKKRAGFLVGTLDTITKKGKV
jgi:hypothetical protein